MKNILIVDGAENCVYDIFRASDQCFDLIFGEETDIAFIEDLENRDNWAEISSFLNQIWSERIPKKIVKGIHGTIFYGLLNKKKYYPKLKMKKLKTLMGQSYEDEQKPNITSPNMHLIWTPTIIN